MDNDFGLPPLDEILGRIEGDFEEEEISIKTNLSRAPRFYISSCLTKEEWIGDGRIQVAEDNKEGYHNVVCKYFEEPYCSRLMRDCPHSIG